VSKEHIEPLDRILKEHPFFGGMGDDVVAMLAGCAKNVRFEPGEYVLREGESADWFFLVREGRVALSVSAPARGDKTILTIGAGEIVGLNWLIPPYRVATDARALERTRVIAMDARCLRPKLEEDSAFGYDMMKRFVPVLVKRLTDARLQMLDLYAVHR
jgi:CRP-like cAMP-binding protein